MAEHCKHTDNKALADKLSRGGYTACVVIGLSGDWVESKPTAPMRESGPWREALVAFVKARGPLNDTYL